jgi:gamma-resorcylate decarboxylase
MPVSRSNIIIRQRSGCDYFCANFHLSTSGNFNTQALIEAMLVIGADRIMFSADWPFENIDHAALWFDSCSSTDRRQSMFWSQYKFGLTPGRRQM